MFPIQSAVPNRHPPLVTWALIAINSTVFLVLINMSPAEQLAFLTRFALIPSEAFARPAGAVTIFTNVFLHGGWLHLFLNMWTLWLFGPAVEDRLGAARYLAFYLLVGALASLTHALFNASSTVPAVGASGAISGVLGCYMKLFPVSRLIVVVPILFIPLFYEVPAVVFAGLWLIVQVMEGTLELLVPSRGSGIAWWAHIGGFVSGVVLTPALRWPRNRHRPYYADEGTLGFDRRGR